VVFLAIQIPLSTCSNEIPSLSKFLWLTHNFPHACCGETPNNAEGGLDMRVKL